MFGWAAMGSTVRNIKSASFPATIVAPTCVFYLLTGLFVRTVHWTLLTTAPLESFESLNSIVFKMKAIVFVSTVCNPEEKLVLEKDHLALVPENLIANDFDLIAVEAAVRLKEKGDLDEVVVFGISPVRDHLLKALAMGADRAVYAEADNAEITPEIVVETALSCFPDGADVIWVLGKLGVNFESHHTPQLLASRLVNCPCIDAAFKIERRDKVWQIQCEADGGIPIFEVETPFVVTADLRLAEPRFPSLPNIIKARKKPFECIDIVKPKVSYGLKPQSLESVEDSYRNCQFLTKDQFCAKIQEMVL